MTQERAKTRKKTRMDFKWIQELWRFHALWRRWNATAWGVVLLSLSFDPRSSAAIRGNPRSNWFQLDAAKRLEHVGTRMRECRG
jgi:hypothetical protein